MSSKRIVLIGKGLGVLQNVHDVLERQGHEVVFHQLASPEAIDRIGDVFAGQRIDIVVLGGALTPDQRTTVRQAFQPISPEVAFFQASAPIPSMIMEEVTAMVEGKRPFPVVPHYDAAKHTLSVELSRAASLRLTCYWIVSQELVTSDQQEVYNGRLNAGQHSFDLPPDTVRHWSFATVGTPDYFVLLPLTSRQQ